MTDIPSGDITGHCEGVRRDRVHEGEAERQKKIADPSKTSIELANI
jgi:hypothetical protein